MSVYPPSSPPSGRSCPFFAPASPRAPGITLTNLKTGHRQGKSPTKNPPWRPNGGKVALRGCLRPVDFQTPWIPKRRDTGLPGPLRGKEGYSSSMFPQALSPLGQNPGGNRGSAGVQTDSRCFPRVSGIVWERLASRRWYRASASLRQAGKALLGGILLCAAAWGRSWGRRDWVPLTGLGGGS